MMVSKKKNISKNVMDKISKEEIKMRPKIYFLMGSVLLGAGLSMALIMAILFTNFFIFRFRVHAPLGYLQFGRLGFRPFLGALPKVPAVIAILSIIGGISLIKKYEISYKRSFVGVIVAMIAFILTTAFIFERTGINERLATIPRLRPHVLGRYKSDDYVAGKVVEISDKSLKIETPVGEFIDVVIDENIKGLKGQTAGIGDFIRIIGVWKNNEFIAKGYFPGKPNIRNIERIKGVQFKGGRNTR